MSQSQITKPANPNLGFKSLGGFHYLTKSSLGSDVPEPVRVEEDVDADLLDDEDEDDAPVYTWACCARIQKMSVDILGGWTVVLMLLVYLAVFIFCLIASAIDRQQPPFVILGLSLGLILATLVAVLLLRSFWTLLVGQLFFPESRTFRFLTKAVDPELGVLIWNFTLWCVQRLRLMKDGDGTWYLGILGNGSAFYVLTDQQYRILHYTVILMLLWSIRNMCVKFILLKLMMQFLMSFNDEVIKILHKYALLRRLNANWIKLIPTNKTIRDQSYESSKTDTQQNLAMTAAMLRRDGSKTHLLDLVRSRELSRMKAMEPRDQSRLTLFRNASKIKSASYQRRTVAHEPSTAVEDLGGHELGFSVNVDNFEIPPPRKSRIDITPAQRRHREREFNIEITGKQLPRMLEREHITSTIKSKMMNMISVLWVWQNPIVLFVDGTRTELLAKRDARAAAMEIFQSLLSFRQDILLYEEQLAPSELEASDAMAIDQRRASHRESNWDIKLTETAAPIVETEHATGHLVNLQGTHGSHRGQDDSATDSGRSSSSSVPRKTTKTSAAVPKGHTSGTSDSKTHMSWFARRQKLPITAASSRPPIFENNHQNKVFHDAHIAAITAAEIRKVKLIMPDDKDCLTRDFFELFMPANYVDDLMTYLDPGKLGRITDKMFLKGVVNVYKMRKQLANSLEAQEGIEGAFRRVCSYLFTFFAILAFLIVVGVNPNTIIVSGSAVLAAVSLILSFLYTDFIQSIILIVCLNPYRIGDRVRLDGEAQYVKKISTYFTEFESLHGKVQYISHKELSSKLLINESRCKVATSELEIQVSEKTTPSQYAALKKVLEAYLKSRPLEWIGDSLFVFISGIGPSQFISISIWATHTESWGNWMAVRTQESAFYHFIMRQASVLGIYYRLPIQRWEPYVPSLNSSMMPSNYGGSENRMRMRDVRTPVEHHPVQPVLESIPYDQHRATPSLSSASAKRSVEFA